MPEDEAEVSATTPKNSTDASPDKRVVKTSAEELKPIFEKYATSDTGCMDVQQLTEVLGEIGLGRAATPRELAEYVKTVASDPMKLTFDETCAVCGLLSTPNLAESGNKYTITARRTYLETGRLATDDAVISFIEALEDHRRGCEREGRYMEARAAAKRISTLKMQEGSRLRREMLLRQEQEMRDAEEAFQLEKREQEGSWKEKVSQYEQELAEAVRRKKQQHAEQLEGFIADMEKKRPAVPKYSRDLLIHRNVEGHLAKQGQYYKATRVKDAADKMEVAEMETTLATFEAEMSLKEGKLRAKQQQELDALIQKGARGRDELEISSVQDLQRRVQRYRNLVAELTNLHKLEVAHLENFLEGKAIAGKCDPILESTFRRKAVVVPLNAVERL